MICSKPGCNEPMPGQTVYVCKRDGQVVGVTLRLTAVVGQMSFGRIDDFEEVPWLE